ncbi:hypothetical protein Q8F55_002754 [Vanrija albida]|uniref:BTB domain-containing protein n=1 Tax=Vanrija albida TaxID=181172 RepID=A0ABR3QB88_9TREE
MDTHDCAGQPSRKRTRSDSQIPEAVTDHDRFKTGDFAVISSDNVRFRVDGHYLQTYSAVFRGMLSGPATGNREIHLSDPTLEHSTTIELFLELVTNSSLDLTQSVVRLIRLVHFLNKYDCASTLKLVRLRLLAFLISGKVTVEHFTLAAVMDDVDLCVTVIDHMTRGAPWGWEPVAGGQRCLASSVRRGTDSLNPQNMPLWLWVLVPSVYQWALSRTFAIVWSPGMPYFRETFKEHVEAAMKCVQQNPTCTWTLRDA